MEQELKESVGTLLAHIIKIDKRDIEKEAPLFCEIMGQNFDCSEEETKTFLYSIIGKEYDLNKHIDIISSALCEDRLSKYHILEQINHIIYSDTIKEEDYKVFEDIKNRLFDCK